MLELKPERLAFDDFQDQTVCDLRQAVLAPTCSGALYWPSEDAAVSPTCTWRRARRSPSAASCCRPTTRARRCSRLAEVIDRYDAGTVIALGDSLHDVRGRRAHRRRGSARSCRCMQEDREWIWITGNHDPEDRRARSAARVLGDIEVDGITLRHEPRPGGVTHEIAGHLHPAARFPCTAISIRRPCFVGNGRRLVHAGFGTFAGGLNVLDDAFQPLFGNGGMRVWMLGQEGFTPSPRGC